MPWWISTFWLIAATLAITALISFYRALFHDRSRGRRRCPVCWYDITTLQGRKCPECGRTAPSELHLSRTRRHWKLAFRAILIAALAYYSARIPATAKNGNLWAAIPLPVLLLVMQFYDSAGDDLLAQVPDPTTLSSCERMLLARACAASIVRSSQTGSAAPSATFLRQLAIASQSSAINQSTLISAAAALPGTSSSVTAAIRGGTWTPSDTLILLGADARPAVSVFITALNSPSVFVRRTASQWLKWPAFRVGAAIAPLCRGCADPDGIARMNCIDALADTGPAAAASFEALCRVLDTDPGHIERIAVLVAIRLVAPDRAAPVLARSLTDNNQLVRCSAVLGLEALGPRAAAAIPALRAALEDRDWIVRGIAERTLRRLESK